MTVSTTTNKIILIGDGVTTTFSFPFAVRANGQADIQVFTTDTSGNIVQLTFGTQYTVTLNAAIAPNPTPVGGTVTTTVAPANLTKVTILRTESLTQTTSLANQGSLYQPVLEATDDNQAMQIQQLAELLGRQITVAISDPTPTALPPAAQRALLFLSFDSNGNPIAANPGGATTPVSSAMAPVVAASTIAAAVALLGLSGVAAEPPGVVKAYAGASAPTGYLLCAGQAVSRTGATAALFAVIGTTYGVGDGSTTFNLPDLRGRVVPGLDNMGGIAANRLTATTIPNSGGPTTLGGNGGFETIVLTQGQLPAVAPTFVSPPQYNKANTTPFNAGLAAPQQAILIFDSTPLSTTNVTSTALNNLGSGNPTPQVQPSICLNWIIKT